MMLDGPGLLLLLLVLLVLLRLRLWLWLWLWLWLVLLWWLLLWWLLVVLLAEPFILMYVLVIHCVLVQTAIFCEAIAPCPVVIHQERLLAVFDGFVVGLCVGHQDQVLLVQIVQTVHQHAGVPFAVC